MTEYVTPNIHTVLKKYQTSAPKSLQGPGHSLNSSASGSNSAVAVNQQQTSVVSSLQLQQNNAQSISNNNTNNTNFSCPLDVSLNNGLNNGSQVTSMVQDMHGLVTMRNSPCDLIKTGHCPINTQAAASAHAATHAAPHANLPTLPSTATTLPAATASALSLSSVTTTLNINPALPLIKKEIMTSPEPIAPQHDLPLEVPLLSSSIQVAPPVQAAIKIMPPPPPEVSQPILSSADSGSGELYETRLEGKTIGCFSLGGEMRLCLPQFLNNVLAEFSLEQINRSFDDLGIFCSQCTPDQLLEFKAAKILPNDVKSSGLITRTDAERLCAILLHRSDRNSYINVEDIPKGAITFKVYHRCFGKCEGICTPDMYSYQKPTCIMCLECKGWFSPQKFVGHVHRKVENRTCHWGFDSRNWHDYLHVALDVENRVKYQKILDELKEVEIKEQIKAQQEINYLKRKAELHMDHSILVPSMGLGPPPPPPHQPLPPSVKHRGGGGAGGGEQHDIPSTKKSKSLDEASAYQLEYQHYQSLMYAHCAQQQRMAAAGQMSAFRPWPQPKTFMHAAYNAAAVAALSTLPYLSQEPPVLQNPERVVRSTDRERFERTYQPNVALAPRKTHLTQEREKEQRELRERERIEREREREMERIRERERSREREREYERERELREREMQKKLQQQQQQQQHQQQIHIKQQPITTMCEADIQIKQERPSTPAELPNTPPPPLSNHSAEADRRSNGPMDHVDEPHPTTPLISPLSLNRSKHLNHMELQTRRLSMHNSNSSAASSSSSTTSSISASSTTPTNLTNTSLTPPQQQHHQQPLIPAQKPIPQQQQPQHLPTAHLQRIPATHHGPIVQHGPQPYIRQSPSPQQQQQQQPHQQHHGHCNNVSCNNPSRSPEEFGGSNEITSSTSPLPTPQQQQQQQQQNHHHQQQQQPPLAQTIITTVNHHNKLMPTCGTFGANTNGAQPQQHNDMTGRIRISKNLINQNNIMRSPTPPPATVTTQPPSSTQQQHPNHPQQQQHPLQQQAGPQTQQQHTIMAAQNHQQQYDYYKQNQRFYQQQQHQQQQQQQHSRNHTPQSPTNQQQQHQQHSPSQSSNTTNTPSGLNLTTALATTTAVATPAAPTSLQQNHDNGSSLKAHLRTPPQAFMNHQQHQPQQHHLQNGRHRSQVATNSEFELSTDTDDESVNDGEADSSNTLTPWELAIETLRDSRPKDRERLLQMLQRILNENQHYRLQNQQLNKLIEVRSEQINKLQIELQQCQRQLEQLQLNNPLTAAATTTLTTTTGLNGGNNGLITKALRKECPSSDEQSLILRVPLKKSQRREPEMYEREAREEQKAQQRECEESLQRQCDERIQYNLSQIKRELSESMEEDEEDEEEEETNTSSTTLTTEQRSLSDNNQQQVESSHQEQEQHLQRERANELASESEQDEEEEEEDDDNGEDEDGDQRMSSTQSPKRSHNEENLHKLQDIKDIKNEKDSLDSIENNQPHNNSNQQEEDDDDDEEEDEEENREREENQVEAPHTNALETPPTATTPLSPDSAATAGQLFDSSNSSDESSMKKAQMSASNALAKMNSETNDDGEEEDEEEDTLTNNEESENEEEDQQQQERETNENLHSSKPRHFVADSLQPLEKALISTTHSSPNIINTSINQLPQTPPNTTTVVLATKASKKLTPTTNNDIKIKQEYL